MGMKASERKKFSMYSTCGRRGGDQFRKKMTKWLKVWNATRFMNSLNHAEGTGYHAIPNSFPLTDSRGDIFDAWAYTPWCGDYITGGLERVTSERVANT